MILLYMGEGKGKTCACVGQTIRCLGQNLAVAFGQFIKREGTSGEQVLLAKLLGARFRAHGYGLVSQNRNDPRHKEAAKELLLWAEKLVPSLFLLVLDELLTALSLELLEEESVRHLCHEAEEAKCHLLFSGRSAPSWLIAKASLVTSMTMVKHPFTQGVKACAGIEY